MGYQSFEFLCFFTIVFLLYYIAGPKRQLWVLALANIAFISAAAVKYLPFILVTMVATFFTGRKIGRLYDEADEKIAACKTPAEKKPIREEVKKKAKQTLLIALVIAIGLLVVCKYTGFILANVNKIMSIVGAPQITLFKMITPIGVSFYTFMALSYVLDIYWKRYKAEDNFLLYAVYLSYFPHIVQGPIDRFNEFKEQASAGQSFDYKNVTFGAQ